MRYYEVQLNGVVGYYTTRKRAGAGSVLREARRIYPLTTKIDVIERSDLTAARVNTLNINLLKTRRVI